MENNLAQDAETYGAALSAHSVGEQYKTTADEKLRQEADEKHAEWSTPVDVVGTTLLGKPVAKVIKNFGKKLIKKGLKTGEDIVRQRVGQLRKKVGSALEDKLNQVKSKVTSTVEDLKGSAESSISDLADRSGFNAVRNAVGQKPLSNATEATEESAFGSSQGAAEQSGSVLTDYKGSALDDPATLLKGDPLKSSDYVSGTGDNVGSSGSSWSNKPAVSETESATPDRGIGGADDDFSDTLQTPKTLSQSGGTGDIAEAPDIGGTGLADTGTIASEATTGGAEAGAGIGAGIEGGLEGAAVAEGGLNPIADIAAAVAGVVALFEGTHQAPPPMVKFNPVNPVVEHGI